LRVAAPAGGAQRGAEVSEDACELEWGVGRPETCCSPIETDDALCSLFDERGGAQGDAERARRPELTRSFDCLGRKRARRSTVAETQVCQGSPFPPGHDRRIRPAEAGVGTIAVREMSERLLPLVATETELAASSRELRVGEHMCGTLDGRPERDQV
jgi:hypothetical protein